MTEIVGGERLGRERVDKDVHAARCGDPLAFERLYVALRPKVHHAAYRWIGDEHEAEDTTQDAFLAAYRCLPRLSDVTAFEGWLLRIARNRAVDRRRRMLRVRPHERAHMEETDGDANSPRVLSRSGVAEPPPEAVAMLNCALDHMGRCLREALRLRYEKGLSCEEIARREGISLVAVKTRLFRARKALRDVLEQAPGDPRDDDSGRIRGRRGPSRPKVPPSGKRTCVADPVR